MKMGIRLVLWLAVVAAVGITLNSAYSTYRASLAMNDVAEVTTRSMGLVKQPPKHLAVQFSDATGKLVADPPAAANQFVEPGKIVVAHVTGNDSDKIGVDWHEFDEHLAAATGLTVTDQPFENDPEDLEAIKNGAITVVVLHAPETPFLVNNYGFQPFAVLAEGGGAIGNHLDIIVPADSSITQPADLRDKTLVCTTPSSITGYRAAVALLMDEQGLRPNVDYTITWSISQKKSITGVADHKYSAAAISDDKLQSLLSKGEVTSSQYRIIYASEVIPRATVGCFYNLKPELAGKIRQAVLNFDPDGSPAAGASTGRSPHGEASETSGKGMRFIAVDYKRDFKLVRHIDDSFDPRIGAKPPKQKTASAIQ